MRIELYHPIANKLQFHAADPSGLRTRRPVIDCRQRQKPPRLRPVLCLSRKDTQLPRVEIRPNRNGHDLLLFAALNQIAAYLGIPPRVTLSGTWYYSLDEVLVALDAWQCLRIKIAGQP